MALTNMQVFNDFVMPAAIEILDQEIEKFNAASGGTILLSADGMTGSYASASFWASLAAADRLVDRNIANAAAPVTDLSELENVAVKIAGGFGPVRYEPSQMTWLQRPTQEGIAVAATQFAQILLQRQLNTAIGATVAAISNNAATVNDVSGGSAIDYGALNNSHALFGDMSGQLQANVMTGRMAHKFIGQNLTNAERLFVSGNVRVIDVLGQVSVITDAPALSGTGPDVDRILTLTPAAVEVGGVSDLITNVETNNGNQRIETTFQADYTFTLGIKGYSWDVANGGTSPLAAAIETGTNWDKTSQFDKMTAGVLTIGDA